jgi:hypothetical protein
MSTHKKVKGTLIGVNGNAFALMGHFQRLAQRQGWTRQEIDAVLDKARQGNYNHLVNTLDEHME